MYTQGVIDPKNDRIGRSRLEVEFVSRLATALHRYGVPAHRLEPLLALVAHRLGLRASFFVEPTSIQMAFEHDDGPVTRFARVEPGADDLGRLAGIDDLARRVVAGSVEVAEADAELDRLVAARGVSPWVEMTGFGLASGTAAHVLGGGWVEMVVATFAGVLVGLLGLACRRWPRAAPVFEGGAAFAVAFGAGVLAASGVPVATDIAVLAGIIVIVPGLSTTTAVAELATRHLASGVARLAAAGLSFGALCFGVLLARRVVEAAFGGVPVVTPTPLPEWTLIPVLLVAPFGFAAVLRAARRDVWAIACTAPIGLLGARLGAEVLDPELGAFVGAFAITAVSNLVARWRDRPATVTLVPGILLLVPGSFGFRGLSSMLERDVVLGMESAAQMMTIALGLVAGMLLANVVAPVRRSL